MPSFLATLKIAAYWIVWILVMLRIGEGHSKRSTLATAGWMLGATCVAAWFTWIQLVDDKKAQSHGNEELESEPASPAFRLFGAGTLAFGGMSSLVLGAVIPELRTHLFILGLIGLVGAVIFLFFGRRASGNDVDL